MGLTDDWKDADFLTLITGAARCRTDPRWLLKVAWVEGQGARALARNPHSSATGLFQWMGDLDPKTNVRTWFGYTRDAFCALGVTGQLPYAINRFLPWAGDLTTLSRVYVNVFLPKFRKESADPEFVLCAADMTDARLRGAYLANTYFDRWPKDGKIQVRELGEAVEDEFSKGGARARELLARLDAVAGAGPGAKLDFAGMFSRTNDDIAPRFESRGTGEDDGEPDA